jgi:drug/metabolite transporter (DMT)-like permease
VFASRNNAVIAGGLVFAVALWGGNNVGTKWLVESWPPIWTGSTRFACAGLLLLAVLRSTDWLGKYVVPSRELNRALWWRGGLSLAAYIVVLNLALRLTSASHVALYLGASPIWALLWESITDPASRQPRRYVAASTALVGVVILLWPALAASSVNLSGELLGLVAGLLWMNYGQQSRKLSVTLSGTEVSAHTMWRAGIWLSPLALIELTRTFMPVTPLLLGVQSYCILAGGVVAFALWNNALRHWPTSRVLLFNNLIPVSTLTWAHFCLGEAVSPTFWVAMILIAAGVILGQTGSPSKAMAEQAEL